MTIRLHPEKGACEILCEGCGAPIEDPHWALVVLVPEAAGYHLGGAYHKLTCDPGPSLGMWEELALCLALLQADVLGARGWER